MSHKQRLKIQRLVYLTAGEMLRSGAWSVSYAAFHLTSVTATLKAIPARGYHDAHLTY